MSNIRNTILEYISKNPGIRYRELLRMLGLTNGVLSYHLYRLESEQMIRIERDGGMTRYYASDVKQDEANILGMLRIPTARRIISYMLENDGSATLDEIAFMLGKAQSTIFWHMKRLMEKGLVNKHDSKYMLRSKHLIAEVLARYNEQLVERVADNYADMMEDLNF
ncbi:MULTISPECIES: winged helix-turn-helix transcriptional regulator [Candidatus Nitrosocaldus]|jgi:predicted transcriptional regulator|uniref:Transcriptional regulator, ArsR family n=1 Tax=Candidatus Nitrosocaldus cavascurensis TaxID=2058097 RepID=A0A2K5ARY5_9ARCH|nr:MULTISPECIES: winged helix-turn-helix transcriptional regulator [Candidatus Nitrosocaldus]SPC34364.1 Transcriptional regulator, ArsR family [Candidatus Nitrosocaldus cavascurensis]